MALENREFPKSVSLQSWNGFFFIKFFTSIILFDLLYLRYSRNMFCNLTLMMLRIDFCFYRRQIQKMQKLHDC